MKKELVAVKRIRDIARNFCAVNSFEDPKDHAPFSASYARAKGAMDLAQSTINTIAAASVLLHFKDAPTRKKESSC